MKIGAIHLFVQSCDYFGTEGMKYEYAFHIVEALSLLGDTSSDLHMWCEFGIECYYYHTSL